MCLCSLSLFIKFMCVNGFGFLRPIFVCIFLSHNNQLKTNSAQLSFVLTLSTWMSYLLLPFESNGTIKMKANRVVSNELCVSIDRCKMIHKPKNFTYSSIFRSPTCNQTLYLGQERSTNMQFQSSNCYPHLSTHRTISFSVVVFIQFFSETDFWRRKIRPFLDFVKPNKCRYYWTFLKAIHIKFLASFRNQFKILFGNRKSHNPILWVIETQIFTTSSQIVTFDLCCDYGVDSIATYFSFALRFSIRFSFNAENDTWHGKKSHNSNCL